MRDTVKIHHREQCHKLAHLALRLNGLSNVQRETARNGRFRKLIQKRPANCILICGSHSKAAKSSCRKNAALRPRSA